MALAYRMLGEHAAAEDVVQDAWLRWSGAGREEIANPAGWLTTVTTRLAIDALTSARARRESYVGPWLPEAEIISESEPADALAAMEQRDEVNLALLWAMERLAPEERAAFLLHDVFDGTYGEIAETLDKTEAACRQMVSRARTRVRDSNVRFDASVAGVSQSLEKFMTAPASLDRAEVLALLAPEAVAISDGGGKASAAVRILNGAEEIAQVWITVASRQKEIAPLRPVIANGVPALAVHTGGEDDVVVTVVPDGEGRIAWIYALRNPEKIKASYR